MSQDMQKFGSDKSNIALIGGVLLVVLASFLLINKSEPTLTPTPSPIQESTNIPQPQVGIRTYTVVKGDTLKEVAEVYGISLDTIKWANNLTSEKLTPGLTLQILPVDGVTHTAVEGNTVESIAKKYNVDPQKIVDFPGNSFADSQYSLTPGSVIIVPDGTK